MEVITMNDFAEKCREDLQAAKGLESVYNLNYVPLSIRDYVCHIKVGEDEDKVPLFLITWGLSAIYPERSAVVGCENQRSAIELAKELGAQHVYAEASDGLFYQGNVVWRSSWGSFST